MKWNSENQMEMLCEETSYLISLVPVATNISGVSSQCLFSGSIEEDEDSLIAVYGCFGQKTIISIASSRLVENGQIDLQV